MIYFILTVCKRWQSLVRASWRRLRTLNFDSDFHSDVRENRTADSGALQKVLQLCGKSLKCINFTHNCISNDILSNISEFCPKLEIISAGYYLERSMMSRITKNLTNLTSFKVCGQNFVEDSLAELFDRNRKLTTLDLNTCHFRADSFSRINHESLETLALSNERIADLELLVYVSYLL